MITIEKSYGVQGAENDMTLFVLQELITFAKQQYGWVGKAVIDTEKITFYKFGLKLGVTRFAPNGLVVNEYGIIRYVGCIIPVIKDKQVLTDIYRLFGKRLPY